VKRKDAAERELTSLIFYQSQSQSQAKPLELKLNKRIRHSLSRKGLIFILGA
jgi:hypothetical protein